MNRSHRVLLAGVAAMTSVYMLAAGAAAALDLDEPVATAQTHDAILASDRGKADLKLVLQVGQNPHIGRDRIRLADKKKNKKETPTYLPITMDSVIITSREGSPAQPGDKGPKSTFKEMTVVKPLDSSTPKLMMKASPGSSGPGMPAGLRR